MKNLECRIWDNQHKKHGCRMLYEKDFPPRAAALVNMISWWNQHGRMPPLMLYTDVNDETGRHIFRDDIVSFNGTLVRIEWNSAEGCFWGGCNKHRFILQYWNMLKVVGNIYENPTICEEIDEKKERETNIGQKQHYNG